VPDVTIICTELAVGELASCFDIECDRRFQTGRFNRLRGEEVSDSSNQAGRRVAISFRCGARETGRGTGSDRWTPLTRRWLRRVLVAFGGMLDLGFGNHRAAGRRPSRENDSATRTLCETAGALSALLVETPLYPATGKVCFLRPSANGAPGTSGSTRML